MIDFTSIESRIRDEYNWVHANIALHPYAAVTAFFMIGFGLGWLL